MERVNTQLFCNWTWGNWQWMLLAFMSRGHSKGGWLRTPPWSLAKMASTAPRSSLKWVLKYSTNTSMAMPGAQMKAYLPHAVFRMGLAGSTGLSWSGQVMHLWMCIVSRLARLATRSGPSIVKREIAVERGPFGMRNQARVLGMAQPPALALKIWMATVLSLLATFFRCSEPSG